MNILTIPRPVFQRHVRDLVQRPTRLLRCPVGLSHWAGHQELLVTNSLRETGRTLQVWLTDDLSTVPTLPADCAGALLLGQQRERGRAQGFVRTAAGGLEPLHRLRLVGAGMHTIEWPDAALEPTMWVAEEDQTQRQERWSRTIHALGDEAWQRLVQLRYGIIGLGRTGTSIAQALARQGVQRLTLIDPDRVELANLGEAGFTPPQIGTLKVEAAADLLNTLALWNPEIKTVAASITHWQALQAAKSCDVLLNCVDHDSARLAVNAIAVLFGKPMIDIATGVHGTGEQREMGADIRLLLPGRCVMCLGGVRQEAEARQVLTSADAEHSFYTQRNWRSERTGSLASLNQCASAIALRTLEDLIAERISTSAWTRIEFDVAGALQVLHPIDTEARRGCPVCALSGWGEDGLIPIGQLLREEVSP